MYESISDNFKKIVSVRGSDGRVLRNVDFSFSIIPPDKERKHYVMIVGLDSAYSGFAMNTNLAIQRYDFTPDQMYTMDAPTYFSYHSQHCIN